MALKDIGEENMLAGCRNDNRRSQEILYRHFAKKMYAVCLCYAGERSLAQDILQESFIKVFKNIKQYKNDGSLEGWIRRIVTNTAIDHIRKKKKTIEYLETDSHDSVPCIHNPAFVIMGFEELMKQVERLPDSARMIFNLHVLDGYSHKEIADQLNITEGTSKSQFSRARKILMNLIGNMNL